jgi:hypothetical protein
MLNLTCGLGGSTNNNIENVHLCKWNSFMQRNFKIVMKKLPLAQVSNVLIGFCGTFTSCNFYWNLACVKIVRRSNQVVETM